MALAAAVTPSRPLLYYADSYEIPLPPGHRFPMGKYAMVRSKLAESGLFDFAEAPLADPEIVALAHSPDYVRRFLTGTLAPEAQRRIGFPWSRGLVRRTLASTGGTLAATRQALARGWGGNLAGGTHHAYYDFGSGYCIFNDLAVSILWLRSKGCARRAAVLDLDVHQGDGTAKLFENDLLVLTISVHGEKNFPARKQISRIDVPLPSGAGDAEYLAAVAGVLPMVRAFRPEVLFFQAGVDALAHDRLGTLSVTLEGLARRDRMGAELARELGVPFVITMGGGYAIPIEITAQAHANVFRTAAETLG